MSFKQLIALPVLSFVLANPVHSLSVATSTFDSDQDGWIWNPVNPAFSWQSTGGNPGGYIQLDDNLNTISGGLFIFAPAKFLGNWLDLQVTDLSFESNIFTTGSVVEFISNNHLVNIEGPGGSAGWLGPEPDPATPWEKISVPITDPLTDTAWTVYSGTWDAILADVTQVRIRMAYYWNAAPDYEITGIDNISLNAVPTPAALPLFAFSLAVIAVSWRRRDRQT